ncbi:Nucleic acid-binding, OB-fold [Cynara cardunculus var. scolymus]|uniref:Nucleic acid-binding, OB-fold n=1 Tax=Cynara cardunculus var. scolymus TaxID=59895 RepID=A0A103Y1L9_CYNCS|nr:Nucleic acid-binding, OB-fold [Cynara cardunculus var. scolymus]
MEFTHLKNLKNDNNNIIIRIRISRMWESLNNKKGGELISLDMILIDEEASESDYENLIHANIWSGLVPKFRTLLHEGVLYEIKNFKVVPSVGNFRPLANDIKIIFQKFTSLKKLEEDTVSKPKNGFQFISAGLVHSRVNDDTILLDVIGCIQVVGHIETVGVGWKKRDLDYNQLLCGVKLPEDFDATTVKMKAATGPVILIVTCTRVKTFQGVVYFATTSASKIFINLRINYVSSLIERFTTVANGVHFIENADEKKRRDEDMHLERMMINDLLCATWDKDMKVPFIIVRGTITCIVSSLGWFYKGCKVCYKQLTTIDGGYFCGNCKAESEFPLVL